MFYIIKSIYNNYKNTYNNEITKIEYNNTNENKDLDPFYFNYLHNFFIIY